MVSLENKVAVVTGASRGIGRSISIALAREKVKICLIATKTENLVKVSKKIESIGGQCIYCTCDVIDRNAVTKQNII